jgi:hypothetical protein
VMSRGDFLRIAESSCHMSTNYKCSEDNPDFQKTCWWDYPSDDRKVGKKVSDARTFKEEQKLKKNCRAKKRWKRRRRKENEQRRSLGIIKCL